MTAESSLAVRARRLMKDSEGRARQSRPAWTMSCCWFPGKTRASACPGLGFRALVCVCIAVGLLAGWGCRPSRSRSRKFAIREAHSHNCWNFVGEGGVAGDADAGPLGVGFLRKIVDLLNALEATWTQSVRA